MDLYIHSPHTPSWCSAKLVKHRDSLTFIADEHLIMTGYFDTIRNICIIYKMVQIKVGDFNETYLGVTY
jgi:hypothetical protein